MFTLVLTIILVRTFITRNLDEDLSTFAAIGKDTGRSLWLTLLVALGVNELMVWITIAASYIATSEGSHLLSLIP